MSPNSMEALYPVISIHGDQYAPHHRQPVWSKKEKQGYDHVVISIAPLIYEGPMQATLQARTDSDASQTDTTRAVAQKRGLANNRPEAVAQRQLAEMMHTSPRVLQQLALSDAIYNSPRMVAQRHQMNVLFGGAVKSQGDDAMPAGASPVQREEKTNKTGLPNQLKSGIESLSGMSMDHIKVHYHSDKPAQLQAHAYAQGSEIHLAPGQEQHLPHEAWHVVQQAQGRVKPTLQMKGGVAVNDDIGLEDEADFMGERAAESLAGTDFSATEHSVIPTAFQMKSHAVVQRGAFLSGLTRPQLDPAVALSITTLRAAFNRQQPTPPARNAIVGATQTTLKALKANLMGLPVLRELVDALVALHSDAILQRIAEIDASGIATRKKADKRAKLYHDKQAILRFRLEIETSYQAIIHNDPAELTVTSMENEATAVKAAGAFLVNRGQAINATLEAAPALKTGAREPVAEGAQQVTNIDIRAAALAKAIGDDGFAPEIIVGLPTGGIQIAARIAGILHATTDQLPHLLALRPRFVKPSGAQAVIPAAEQTAINARDMHSFADLNAINHAEKGNLAILIVDDFSLSGASLSQAAAQVAAAFAASKRPVTVRTALSRYAAAQLGDGPGAPAPEQNPLNEIYYVAGTRGTGRRASVRAAGPGGQALPDWANDNAEHLHHGWTETGENALGAVDAINPVQ